MKLRLAFAFAGMATAARAWDAQPQGYEVIDGPASADDTAQWRSDWGAWRRMELAANRYDPSDRCGVYNIPGLQWTQRNFVQAMLLLHDRAIFDRKSGRYTADKYLDDMERRVGKLDSVLLWPTYPNIGIDGRNQWQLLRDLPGGLDALRDLVKQFHDRNVRVIIPYNPWDTGTQPEVGMEDAVRMYNADIATLNELISVIGADGFNGDTMYGVPTSFFNCSQPIAATPEGGVPTAFLGNNPMSWGYFYGYARFPPVARAKFLEPRHMVQVCARWSLDRLAEVQTAFFNGAGYVVWENVWGIWNSMTNRESEATRRAFNILRKFDFAISSPSWKPYYEDLRPARRLDGIFASEFPIDEGDGGWFYTIISTADVTKTVKLPLTKHIERLGDGHVRAYDVYRGVELKLRKQSSEAPFISITVESSGFGAVYVAPTDTGHHPVPTNFSQFLEEMNVMTVAALSTFSSQRPLLQQKLIGGKDPASASQPKPRRPTDQSGSASSGALSSSRGRYDGDSSSSAASDLSALRNSDDINNRDHNRQGMVHIRGADNWWFNVTGVQIEPVPAWTPDWALLGTGVQFPWENRPWNNHSVQLMIQDYFIDRYPVTNIEFARFLQDSKYSPQSLDRFLEHWTNRVNSTSKTMVYNPLSEWKIPPSLVKSPVVNVARDDAEAYATFYGKRLPHDWEWQYVVSNGDRYTKYPWGNDWDASKVHSVMHSGYSQPLPDPVGSYPQSQSSAFGVEDLVGYIWQMTDRFCDDHTCGLLLRGGSYFRPISSTLSDPNWYFPQALESQQHNRFLMLSPSYDRSSFVGFRCAVSSRNSNDAGFAG